MIGSWVSSLEASDRLAVIGHGNAFQQCPWALPIATGEVEGKGKAIVWWRFAVCWPCFAKSEQKYSDRSLSDQMACSRRSVSLGTTQKTGLALVVSRASLEQTGRLEQVSQMYYT